MRNHFFTLIIIILSLSFINTVNAEDKMMISVQAAFFCTEEMPITTVNINVQVNAVQQTFKGNTYFTDYQGQSKYLVLTGSYDENVQLDASFNIYETVPSNDLEGLIRTESFIGSFDELGQLNAPTTSGTYDSNWYWQAQPCNLTTQLSLTTLKPEYPVLFIHGLNSNADTWHIYQQWASEKGLIFGGKIKVFDKFHLSLPSNDANENVRTGTSFLYDVIIEEGEPDNGDYFTLNLSNNNDISFAAQGLQVREAVNTIIEKTGKNGVYVVGHSMGGLATRAYLQYFFDDKVKGLITIGTPHKGTPRADLGSVLPGSISSELDTDSDDIALVNNFETYPLPENVNYYAIAARGRDKNSSDVYSDNTGDGVVPIWSQRPEEYNWDGTEILIEEEEYWSFEVHTHETENTEIRKAVWDKLISW